MAKPSGADPASRGRSTRRLPPPTLARASAPPRDASSRAGPAIVTGRPTESEAADDAGERATAEAQQAGAIAPETWLAVYDEVLPLRIGGPAPGEPSATAPARPSTVGMSPWERWLELTGRIDGFPRHLSIHTGGMLITPRR